MEKRNIFFIHSFVRSVLKIFKRGAKRKERENLYMNKNKTRIRFDSILLIYIYWTNHRIQYNDNDTYRTSFITRCLFILFVILIYYHFHSSIF